MIQANVRKRCCTKNFEIPSFCVMSSFLSFLCDARIPHLISYGLFYCTVCDRKDLTDDDRIDAILEAIDKALGIGIQVKWPWPPCYQNARDSSFMFSKHLLTRNHFKCHTELNPTNMR